MVRRRTSPDDPHFVGLVLETTTATVVGDSVLILQGAGLSEGEIGWTILPRHGGQGLRDRGRPRRPAARLRALRPAPRRGQPRRPQRPLRRPLRAPRHAARGAQARRLLVQGQVDRLVRVRPPPRGVARAAGLTSYRRPATRVRDPALGSAIQGPHPRTRVRRWAWLWTTRAGERPRSSTLAGMAFDPTQPFLRADGLAHGLSEKAMRGPGYRQAVPQRPGRLDHPADRPAARARSAGAPVRAGMGQPRVGRSGEGRPDPDDRRRARQRRAPEAPSPPPGHPLPRRVTRPAVVVEKGVRVSSDVQMFIELGGQLTPRRPRGGGRLAGPQARAHSRGAAWPRAGRAGTAIAARHSTRRRVRPARRRLADGDPAADAARAGRDARAGDQPRRSATSDGEVVRRYDLCFPAVRVVVEYNGKVHIELIETGSTTSSGAPTWTTTGGGWSW